MTLFYPVVVVKKFCMADDNNIPDEDLEVPIWCQIHRVKLIIINGYRSYHLYREKTLNLGVKKNNIYTFSS